MPDVKTYEAHALGIAKGQIGSIFQTGFMLYMVGSSLNLMSIMILTSMATGPITNLLRLDQGEEREEHAMEWEEGWE